VHAILVYGGSEREILLWDLSSPTVATPTPIFPTCPITVRSHCHRFPCIARCARVVSISTANAPSCDDLPGGRLKHLSSDFPPARPPARFRVKRPPDPLLGACAPRRHRPSLSLPNTAPCLPLWAQTTTQTARQDDDDALAVPGFGSSAPSRFRARAVGGGTRPTVGGAHGGVGSGADDDIVPGFCGCSSEVPGLGSGGGGFGGGAGSRSGLMANPGGRQNGPLMSWAAVMDGQGLRGGRQADDRGHRQGSGDGADRGDIGSGGGGYDGGGHSAGFGGGGMAQAEPAGADAIE
jgi:hypothetical protein